MRVEGIHPRGGVVASSRWRPVERGGGLYDMGGACSAASRACEAAERGAWSRRTLPPAVEGRVAGSEPAEAEAVRVIGLDGLNANETVLFKRRRHEHL